MKKLYIIILFLLILIGALCLYILANRPTVSVIMPTYKRAHLLPTAINSILSQTYKDFELIIINDGSDDNTDQIVSQFKDKRIRYYKNNHNKGIAFTRNRGFNLAKGKYIMIMDDDDTSLPNRIKKQVTFLDNNPQIDVVAGQIQNLSPIPNTHDQIATELILHNVIGNANIMYRKNFALSHNIKYDEHLPLSEDWNYWLDMLFSGAKFHATNDIVLVRNIFSHKHHTGNFEDGNVYIREKIGQYFSPQNSNDFYKASSCEKLQMIAPKKIFSDTFLKDLTKQNCN